MVRGKLVSIGFNGRLCWRGWNEEPDEPCYQDVKRRAVAGLPTLLVFLFGKHERLSKAGFRPKLI